MSSSGTSAMPRDVWTIVNCGWTPHELLNFEGTFVDGLFYPCEGFAVADSHMPEPQPDLVVSASVADRLPLSGCKTLDFHSLHSIFAPTTQHDANASGGSSSMRRGILCKPHTRISCSLILTNKPSDASPVQMLQNRASLVITRITEVITGLSRQFDVFLQAERCFRIATSVFDRRFVVRRSKRDAFVLLQCLRRAFPFFLVPIVPSFADLELRHLEHLLDCVSVHAEDLASFFPLMFFLFESSSRNLATYFAWSAEQHEANETFDNTPLRASLAAPLHSSSRFSFLSFLSSPFTDSGGTDNEPVTPPATDFEVICDTADVFLPPHFARSYSLGLHVSSSCEGIHRTAKDLEIALFNENDALQNIADSLAEFGGCFDLPLPPFCCGIEEEDVEPDCTIVDVLAATTAFVNDAAMEQRQGALPLVHSMVMAVEICTFTASSLRGYFCSAVSWARDLRSYESLLKRGNTSSGEHMTPQLRAGAIAGMERCKKSLALFRNHHSAEVDYHMLRLFDTLRSVFVFIATITKHFGKSFERAADEARRPPVAAQDAFIEEDVSLTERAHSGIDLWDGHQQIEQQILMELPHVSSIQLKMRKASGSWPSALPLSAALQSSSRPASKIAAS